MARGPGFPVTRIERDGEATVDVLFNDGTSLTNVFALHEFTASSFETSVSQYLLDGNAMAAAGPTVADVIQVDLKADVDHDLSWTDLGFTPTGTVVQGPEASEEVFGRFFFADNQGGTEIDNAVLSDFDLSRSDDLFEAFEHGNRGRPEFYRLPRP